MADTTITSVAEFNALDGNDISAGDTVSIDGLLEGELITDFSGTTGNPVYINSVNNVPDTGSGSNVSGANVFPAFSTGSADHLTIRNLDFSGAESTSASSQVVRVSRVSTGITLQNLFIHDTPIGAGLDLASGDGIRVSGVGTLVTDCALTRFQNDGIYVEERDCTFSFLSISNVSLRRDEVNGDCLKWTQTDDLSNSYANNCLLDHSSARDKACLLMSGNISTTGMLSEYNKHIGGQRSLLIRGAALTIARRGLIQPSDTGYKHGNDASTPEITNTTGVRMESHVTGSTGVGHVTESMIVESVTRGLSPSNAASAFSAPHTIRGATICCDVQTVEFPSGNPRPSIVIAQVYFGALGGASRGTFQNNIVMGPNNTASTYFISAASGDSPTVLDNNVYIGLGRWNMEGVTYADFAAYQVAGHEPNSQHLTLAQASDLFVDWQDGDFRIKDNQTVMTAIGAVVAYKDINGVDQPSPPQIGAYALELAQTPTQYPQWGPRENSMYFGCKYNGTLPAGATSSASSSDNKGVVSDIANLNANGMAAPIYTEDFVITRIHLWGAVNGPASESNLSLRMYPSSDASQASNLNPINGSTPIIPEIFLVANDATSGTGDASEEQEWIIEVNQTVIVTDPVQPQLVMYRAAGAGFNMTDVAGIASWPEEPTGSTRSTAGTPNPETPTTWASFASNQWVMWVETEAVSTSSPTLTTPYSIDIAPGDTAGSATDGTLSDVEAGKMKLFLGSTVDLTKRQSIQGNLTKLFNYMMTNAARGSVISGDIVVYGDYVSLSQSDITLTNVTSGIGDNDVSIVVSSSFGSSTNQTIEYREAFRKTISQFLARSTGN